MGLVNKALGFTPFLSSYQLYPETITEQKCFFTFISNLIKLGKSQFVLEA